MKQIIKALKIMQSGNFSTSFFDSDYGRMAFISSEDKNIIITEKSQKELIKILPLLDYAIELNDLNL